VGLEEAVRAAPGCLGRIQARTNGQVGSVRVLRRTMNIGGFDGPQSCFEAALFVPQPR
jgi:hypothetical protein